MGLSTANDLQNVNKKINRLDKHTKGTTNIMEYAYLKVGDDWTAAIENAIADIESGWKLVFPEGTYEHTGIKIDKPIHIEGCGKYKTILKNTSTSNPAITINNAERGCFKNIGIFGNGTAAYGTDATSGKGIYYAGNAAIWLFDDVWMRGHGDWFIYANGKGHVNNITITNSELEYGASGAIHLIQDSSSAQINAVHIANSNISGFSGNNIEVWGQSITIDNCTIQGSKGHGVVIDGSISGSGNSIAKNIRIINNYFELCNQGFIYVKSIISPVRYAHNVNIIGNYGTYNVISGDIVDTTNISIVEVDAPEFYSYDNMQVSAFSYMSNDFCTDSMCKCVLNANNVLSYDSIIQRKKENDTNINDTYINLGKARILDRIDNKKVIKGITYCVSHPYTIDKSPNITETNTEVIFDVPNHNLESLTHIAIPINTDATDYNITVYVKSRTACTLDNFRNTALKRITNTSGSQTLTCKINSIEQLDCELYISVKVIYNTENTVSYFYLGNPVLTV